LRITTATSSKQVKAVLDTATQTLVFKSVSGGGVFIAATVEAAETGYDEYTLVGSFDATTEAAGLMLTREVDGENGITVRRSQLEVGAFASSYIPTTSSQVTRAADIAVMTGTNFSSWFNATEGTLFAEYSYNGAVPGVVRASLLTVSDIGNNRLALRASDPSLMAKMAVGTGSSVLSLDDPNNTAPGVFRKISGAYGPTGTSLTSNGTTPNTATGTANVIGSQLEIGRGESVSYLFGHIRRIAYWNTRLTNAELQSLTS
jgi:hypothetical protein